jgi:serine/threonine protein kinase
VLARYRPIERLGAGGFGEVWRAHDEQLHRDVALKRIHSGPGGDGERAAREAHASARLEHPAIVRLYEACAEGETFYLISELVEGETLAALIAADELDDAEILEIGLALTGALSHAHDRGVIHRDVKPQNVLVPAPAADGQRESYASAAKLADFGGAALVGEDALTRSGDVLGTLAYMAPEQTEGRDVGEAADLYSLALVLYEALSGVNPVRGATPAATARRIGGAIEPLHRRRRDLPRALTRAIDTALARSPRARGSLAELDRELEQALSELTAGGADRTERPSPAELPRWSEAPPRRAIPRRPREAAGTEERPLPDRATALEQDPRPARHLPALPVGGWMVAGLILLAWQIAVGRAGLALLIVAALVPVLAMPRTPDGRLGSGWLAAAFAPLLGLAGLAGAYPAIAGQAQRWRERAVLGALGYWWLLLAEALLDAPGGALWLGEPAGTPTRTLWEGSVSQSAAHVVAPLIGIGALLGALLWAAGALVLPWIVRGRSAVLDVVAASTWAAALAVSAPELDAGLPAGAPPSPHGVALATVLAAALAVAARALRGPV